MIVAADIAVFDGWSEKTLKEAAGQIGISHEEARLLFPRGGIDIAKFYHQLKDQDFIQALRKLDISNLSHSQKVEIALKTRLQSITDNKEAFRRSMALFATPMYQLEAINLVWSTCDLIWLEIKDKSHDFSWYTKRVTLVAIYLSVLLFFLGDDSKNHEETEDFIARRLRDLGKLSKFKLDFLEFLQKFVFPTR